VLGIVDLSDKRGGETFAEGKGAGVVFVPPASAQPQPGQDRQGKPVEEPLGELTPLKGLPEILVEPEFRQADSNLERSACRERLTLKGCWYRRAPYPRAP
jgi:hypothetical protein